MLEKAKEVTKKGKYTHIKYARWADDIIILLDAHTKWDWLEKAILQRLYQELKKIDVTLNEEKTKTVNLEQKQSFNFLEFTYRKKISKQGKVWAERTPKAKSRTKHLRRLKQVFRAHRSQSVKKLIEEINSILRGWANYFGIGNAGKCFNYVKTGLNKNCEDI